MTTPMLLSAEFIESQVEEQDLKNSILSIKRQIFLIASFKLIQAQFKKLKSKEALCMIIFFSFIKVNIPLPMYLRLGQLVLLLHLVDSQK